MSRIKKILVGAAIGFGGGFAYALLQGPILYIPETRGIAGLLFYLFDPVDRARRFNGLPPQFEATEGY
jgi:hypothetical protein